MNECEKCGSDRVRLNYIPYRKLINPSSLEKVNNEFIESSEYDYYYALKSAKEHLLKTCNNCGYKQRVNVKQ